MTRWIRRLGGSLTRFIWRASETAGFGLILALRTCFALPHAVAPRRARSTTDLLFTYAVAALPVTIVVSIFTGMILAMNGGITLRDFGQTQLLGRFVSVSMVREMGPFMTGLILAAMIGSGMAAEIGTMRVSEEIDALEIMSISPIRFLVLPRIVALTLICPVMTIFSAVIGTIGGAAIGTFQFHVSVAAFRNDALEALALKDLYTGLFKSFVFGVTIAVVACTQGLRTRGGATGVGNATRRSVVISFLLIIMFGYFLTWFFYR